MSWNFPQCWAEAARLQILQRSGDDADSSCLSAIECCHCVVILLKLWSCLSMTTKSIRQVCLAMGKLHAGHGAKVVVPCVVLVFASATQTPDL
eukprot:5660555-Amphidinium_carterae.1